MKKLHILLTIFMLGLASITWTSCSESGSMDVDIHDPSCFFEPSEDDNSLEANLRRAFQYKHNAFLLFNDTLQHRFNGLDINGDSTF